ncbi:MAG: BREX-6 system phosphatase PglZ, partial [Pirellulaceae bacterium]
MSGATDHAVLGPVSTVLEGDVREWLSRHNLVIWLDADNHYCDFVEQLIKLRQNEELKYDVYTFRGSHLELMLGLEDVTGGVDKTRALIHLPGFNEETVKATPLFELYRAGRRYRKALSTLVADAAAGNVRPDQIEEFLGRDNLTLSAADVWLHDLRTKGSEGLASQLRNVSPTELVDDLLFKRFLAQRVTAAIEAGDEQDQRALWDRVAALTGMPESWRDESLATSTASAEGIAYTISSWALCVSYVCDLTGPPKSGVLQPIPSLPKQVKEACCELAAHLQDTHPDFYRQTADETESRLDEIGHVEARDLGRVDTFRFEEEVVLKAALQALKAADWPVAQNWAERRSDPETFWLRDDALRRNVWQLVADAARLGVAITKAGPSLQAADSLQSAVDEYTRVGAEVDQAHRHLEQDRQKLLRSQMPEFVATRSCLDQMQTVWRDWANAWARGFNSVCRTHGFLPDTSLQQRTLFNEEVKPLTSENGTTAFFVVDAFRYEMGQELLEAVEDAAQTNVNLAWRLSELPSVTEVGMNVLAPVASNDRLKPELSNGKILGFSTGEFRVSDPKSRQRAMHDRIGGGTCPWLDLSEVLRRDAKSLTRTIARSKLIVVHSREIDNAGEEGFGPSVFESVMKDLRSAWHLLREAGVRHFVFTADHGFLLVDEESHTAQPHGRKVDPKRRHVILDRAADHAGEVRVAMRDLGYDCEDAHLVFPESIAVFDTGRKRKGFAHGGNSFQERVIPVLTVSHRTLTGGSTTTYDITAVRKDEVAGMHCIAAKVEVLQKSFDFGSSFVIDLGLRVPDISGVRSELCETRGGARLSSGTIVANVGEEFELFFRLSGNTRSRVQVELYHPSAEANVKACVLRERFDVTMSPFVPRKVRGSEGSLLGAAGSGGGGR